MNLIMNNVIHEEKFRMVAQGREIGEHVRIAVVPRISTNLEREQEVEYNHNGVKTSLLKFHTV